MNVLSQRDLVIARPSPQGEGGASRDAGPDEGASLQELVPHPSLRDTLSRGERARSTLLFVFLLAMMSVVPAHAQTKTPPVPVQKKAAETKTEQAKPEEPKAKSEEPKAQTEEPKAQPDEPGKLISTPGAKGLGISILGNQEAPKSLVIVPWKTSELGNAPGISTMLDDSRSPVDKEVFMRMLSYYEIRSESARPNVPSTDTQRRKQ